MKFDVPYVRRQFPALERTIDGRPVAYFDSPGGTQVPRRVVDAVSDYLVNHNSNTHGYFATTIETDHLLADARDALADFSAATGTRWPSAPTPRRSTSCLPTA